MIYGPAGRRTLLIDAREALNHTNHGTTSQRLHRILCIVFFSRCIAKCVYALMVCGRRRSRKTIVLSARQTRTDKNRSVFDLVQSS